MSLSPMQWVAVRCCCTPAKVLGFIRLPASLVRDGETILVIARRRADWQFESHAESWTAIAQHEARVSIRRISEAQDGTCRDELAVYSEDRPPEWWLTIDGFIPASSGPA